MPDLNCPKCREMLEAHEDRKANPSITVGTQVRLTGVVTEEKAHGLGDVMVNIGCHAAIPLGVGGTCICVPAEALEVIRQPFKRGEVVHREDSKYVVVENEEGGSVKLTTAFIGAEVFLAVASDFERRPSRPKEER